MIDYFIGSQRLEAREFECSEPLLQPIWNAPRLFGPDLPIGNAGYDEGVRIAVKIVHEFVGGRVSGERANVARGIEQSPAGLDQPITNRNCHVSAPRPLFPFST
jgi:hypothetical protein